MGDGGARSTQTRGQ